MRWLKSSLALAFLPLSISAFPQSVVVDRSYVIRAETTTVDTYTGMTHVCILVMPDGHYRRERSFQGMSGGTPYSRVYLDKLPDDSLKRLQSILDDDKFQRIATAPMVHFRNALPPLELEEKPTEKQ